MNTLHVICKWILFLSALKVHLCVLYSLLMTSQAKIPVDVWRYTRWFRHRQRRSFVARWAVPISASTHLRVYLAVCARVTCSWTRPVASVNVSLSTSLYFSCLHTLKGLNKQSKISLVKQIKRLIFASKFLFLETIFGFINKNKVQKSPKVQITKNFWLSLTRKRVS